MNKPTLYFLALITTITSACHRTERYTITENDKKVKLKLERSSAVSGQFLEDNPEHIDSILYVKTFDKKCTKTIEKYANKPEDETYTKLVDGLSTYNKSFFGFRTNLNSFYRYEQPEITENLFIACDEKWVHYIGLINQIKAEAVKNAELEKQKENKELEQKVQDALKLLSN